MPSVEEPLPGLYYQTNPSTPSSSAKSTPERPTFSSPPPLNLGGAPTLNSQPPIFNTSSYFRQQSPSNLDTIHESDPFFSSHTIPKPTPLTSISAGRRRSVAPSQLLSASVEELEAPFGDGSGFRPRGQSFDMAFMLPTKRDRLQQDHVGKLAL